MLRQPARRADRSPTALAAASLVALVLCGCGIKGPLVPPKAAGPDARPPPEATTVPNIPSANPSVNAQPAP
jgi:predicted small lipoprotein YifL